MRFHCALLEEDTLWLCSQNLTIWTTWSFSARWPFLLWVPAALHRCSLMAPGPGWATLSMVPGLVHWHSAPTHANWTCRGLDVHWDKALTSERLELMRKRVQLHPQDGQSGEASHSCQHPWWWPPGILVLVLPLSLLSTLFLTSAAWDHNTGWSHSWMKETPAPEPGPGTLPSGDRKQRHSSWLLPSLSFHPSLLVFHALGVPYKHLRKAGS